MIHIITQSSKYENYNLLVYLLQGQAFCLI